MIKIPYNILFIILGCCIILAAILATWISHLHDDIDDLMEENEKLKNTKSNLYCRLWVQAEELNALYKKGKCDNDELNEKPKTNT